MVGEILQQGKRKDYKKLLVGSVSTVKVDKIFTQAKFEQALEGGTDIDKMIDQLIVLCQNCLWPQKLKSTQNTFRYSYNQTTLLMFLILEIVSLFYLYLHLLLLMSFSS